MSRTARPRPLSTRVECLEPRGLRRRGRHGGTADLAVAHGAVGQSHPIQIERGREPRRGQALSAPLPATSRTDESRGSRMRGRRC
jgi:hypothetical protein